MKVYILSKKYLYKKKKVQQISPAQRLSTNLHDFISKIDCNSKTCSVRIFGMLHNSLKGI